MKKTIHIAAITALAILTVCCDEHKDFPDLSVKVGDVLCTDGSILSYDRYEDSGLSAIGVIFATNPNREQSDRAYAIYLRDTPELQFCDTIGTSQSTSTSLIDLDGNYNTYQLYTNTANSPLANYVFDMWEYGQSAYIPSVAQMTLLYSSLVPVNKTIERLGGQTISADADETWYWTSTEVAGQSADKAWLFSAATGAIHETPKCHRHRARPAITIYNE